MAPHLVTPKGMWGGGRGRRRGGQQKYDLGPVRAEEALRTDTQRRTPSSPPPHTALVWGHHLA